MITKSDDLEALCERLAEEPFVTVDTEFLRDATYWPILCLIQVAGPGGTRAIIDPLGEIDLKPFYRFLGSGKTVKVFHAGRQDVEIFYHAAKIIPAPIFDTQIAAMVAGFGDSASYETLAQKIAGATIDKSARFTDWRRRPLSEKQLAYAISDVTHLLKVYEYLSRELDSQGRSSWIEDELRLLTDPATYDLSPERAFERLRLRDTRPRALALAIEVAAWREREAQRRDVPRSRILKDDTLQEILQEKPKDKESLDRLRSLPRGWANSELGQGLLAAVQHGLARPTDDLPKRIRERKEPIAPARVDILKALLRARSEEHHIAPKLIATTDDLEAFIAGTPNSPLAHGWRYEVFGRDARLLLEGRLALTLKGDAVGTVEVTQDAL